MGSVFCEYCFKRFDGTRAYEEHKCSGTRRTGKPITERLDEVKEIDQLTNIRNQLVGIKIFTKNAIRSIDRIIQNCDGSELEKRR